jgi:hypothetical protein
MADDKRQSFWSTLPGLMTGLAALVTALTGIYVAVERSRNRDAPAMPQPLASQSPAPSQANAAPAAIGAASAPASASATVLAEPVVLFENGNTGDVRSGPTEPTRFTIDRPHLIDDIRTYHWNDGHGAPPRTIALVAADGTRHGPWEASASPGEGGAPNVNWSVRPRVTLPAGTYTIVDGGRETWSYNAESGDAGFAFVRGRPVE